MKACYQYAEELACCAATDRPPASGLAAHLQNCTECRGALNELCRVAELNRQVAVGLSEPSKSVSLASAFLNSLGQQENSWRRHFLKPVLILSAVAACVAIFVAIWGFQKTPGPSIAFVEAPKIG